MKRLNLLFVLLVFGCSALAQSVTVKKDIVYKDDLPYCKMIKTSPLVPRFSIRNMNDEELMVAKFSNEDQRYTIIFPGSGQQCYMSGTMGFGKILAKDIVASNVIVDNKINPAGERLFLLEHGVSNSSGNGGALATGNAYDVVERDRTKLLMVFGNEISQDNKTIGSYSARTSTVNGKLMKVISFMLPGGRKVAEGTMDGINPRFCQLLLMKHNEVETVSIKSFDDMGQAKELAAYLVGRNLL